MVKTTHRPVLGSQLLDDSSYCRPPRLAVPMPHCVWDRSYQKWSEMNFEWKHTSECCDKDTGTSTLTSTVRSALSSLFLMKGWMIYVYICRFHRSFVHIKFYCWWMWRNRWWNLITIRFDWRGWHSRSFLCFLGTWVLLVLWAFATAWLL